mmetsp:Transcript_5196/g.14546  ORF Transcript_5196/g.14546 Transcript_5196/m.14546 type:complete len:261 (-) Transcript_5196:1299-2081(-)
MVVLKHVPDNAEGAPLLVQQHQKALPDPGIANAPQETHDKSRLLEGEQPSIHPGQQQLLLIHLLFLLLCPFSSSLLGLCHSPVVPEEDLHEAVALLKLRLHKLCCYSIALRTTRQPLKDARYQRHSSLLHLLLDCTFTLLLQLGLANEDREQDLEPQKATVLISEIDKLVHCWSVFCHCEVKGLEGSRTRSALLPLQDEKHELHALRLNEQLLVLWDKQARCQHVKAVLHELLLLVAGRVPGAVWCHRSEHCVDAALDAK